MPPTPIAPFPLRSGIGYPGAHDAVEPGTGHAPVRILVRAHVMVVVPPQMRAGPVGIEVRTLVGAVIADRIVPDGRCEEGRDREEREVGDRQKRNA